MFCHKLGQIKIGTIQYVYPLLLLINSINFIIYWFSLGSTLLTLRNGFLHLLEPQIESFSKREGKPLKTEKRWNTFNKAINLNIKTIQIESQTISKRRIPKSNGTWKEALGSDLLLTLLLFLLTRNKKWFIHSFSL